MGNDTLILVHVIVRHGERATDSLTQYPNDPHKKNEFYPYGEGKLTNAGKSTMYTLGKKYRDRYNEFLGDIYLPEHLETWTTEYIRTRTSAQLFLASLYPPKGILKWDNDLNWQPIHTNYNPLITDELLGPVIKTEKFLNAYRKVFQTEFGKSILEKYKDIIPYLEEHTGWEIISTRRLFIVRDCLQTQAEFGLELPAWTQSVYPDRLLQASYEEYRMETCNKELKRLTCGKLLKKILTDTKNKVKETSKYKIHLYLGHDVNIANVLEILGLMYDHLPKYGSSISLEVHKISGRYGFKLYYKKDKDAEFQLMPFNGEEVWWLENLEKLVDDIWSDDVNIDSEQ